MARTKQIQKTRNAELETITKTAITQQQSLEVVQTLLHGGLSSVAYLRELFVERAFDDRTYALTPQGRLPSYQDYAAGELAQHAEPGKTDATRLMVLRRDRSKRVDVFLDWLEKGAFVALREGKLQALQILVHPDCRDRDKVIETYTFTVTYHNNPKRERRVSSLQLESSGETVATVGTAAADLQTLLRSIMALCEKLPHLPMNRFVSMALFYVPDKEEEYRPQGFTPSKTNRLNFLCADGWERTTAELPELTSAFHSTSLKASYLCQSHLKSLPQVMGVRSIPSRMEQQVNGTRTQEIVLDHVGMEDEETQEEANAEARDHTYHPRAPIVDLESTTQASRVAEGTRTNSRAATLRKPSSMVTLRIGKASLMRSSQELNQTMLPPLAFAFPESQDSQSSHVIRMRTALQGMMLSENLTQGDTQTQTALRNDMALHDTSDSLGLLANMPPPKTPASRLRKTVTPSTASGLDLAMSRTPYRTPMRAGALSKRGREEDDVFSSPSEQPANRTPIYKRLKSIQTQLALNANPEVPSSPSLQ